MKYAFELFEDTLSWLRNNYSNFRFFTERDVVWTVQTQLAKQIGEGGLPFKVFNDYPMLKGNRRSLSADLAILNAEGSVEAAIEFKYEPSHKRGGIDILNQKFPVVIWSDVCKDVDRIHEFISQGKAQHAYAVFIDEGGYFCKRSAYVRSKWLQWVQNDGVWLLYAHAASSTTTPSLS